MVVTFILISSYITITFVFCLCCLWLEHIKMGYQPTKSAMFSSAASLPMTGCIISFPAIGTSKPKREVMFRQKPPILNISGTQKEIKKSTVLSHQTSQKNIHRCHGASPSPCSAAWSIRWDAPAAPGVAAGSVGSPLPPPRCLASEQLVTWHFGQKQRGSFGENKLRQLANLNSFFQVESWERKWCWKNKKRVLFSLLIVTGSCFPHVCNRWQFHAKSVYNMFLQAPVISRNHQQFAFIDLAHHFVVLGVQLLAGRWHEGHPGPKATR